MVGRVSGGTVVRRLKRKVQKLYDFLRRKLREGVVTRVRSDEKNLTLTLHLST